MPDASVEVAGKYISREKALNAIREYGEAHVGEKVAPSWTAAKIGGIIAQLGTRETGFIRYGEILRDFEGLNISFGVCSDCGKKLIWYTDEPINGCPYCYMRVRKKKHG